MSRLRGDQSSARVALNPVAKAKPASIGGMAQRSRKSLYLTTCRGPEIKFGKDAEVGVMPLRWLKSGELDLSNYLTELARDDGRCGWTNRKENPS